MKKKERKLIKEHLILAIKKQLLEDNAEISDKNQRAIEKSIKQIVKKVRIRKVTSIKKKKATLIASKHKITSKKSKASAFTK